MSDELVFAVNGLVIRLPAAQVSPTTKLAHYLRDSLQLRGTKIGCGEGGCGACSVLLSRWDANLQRIVTVTGNACLRTLPSLHGYMVTTIEGIGSPQNPHDIQKRFHQLNASQCGFCTPGFVVSLYSQLTKKPDSTMHDIEEALDGNLCRCTGYRPILDASKSFAVDSNVTDSIAHGTLHHADAPPASHGMESQQHIQDTFPAVLKKLPIAAARFTSAGGVAYVRATSVEHAVRGRAAAGEMGAFVASQTSAGVYKDHLPHKKVLIDVSFLPSLNEMSVTESEIIVGAAIPISTAIGFLLQIAAQTSAAALAAGHERSHTAENLQGLAAIIKKIANVHVRDVASIGGNLIMCKNLGFASDLATPLCGADARVDVATAHGRQRLPLSEFLQSADGPQQISLLERVVIPLSAPSSAAKVVVVRCFRQAIRIINAHAILNASFRAELECQSEGSGRSETTVVLRNVRCFFGAAGEFDVPGKNAPRRHTVLESLLEGQELHTLTSGLVWNHGSLSDAEDAFIGTPYKQSHRRKLVRAFLADFLQCLSGTTSTKCAGSLPLHEGHPMFTVPTKTDLGPVGAAVPRPDGVEHACGSAIYVSDIKESKDALYLAWVQSTVPKGTVKDIPVHLLASLEGRPRFFGPDVFTGDTKNEVLNILKFILPLPCIQNFPILSTEVNYPGQYLGVVAADSLAAAQAAAKLLTAGTTYTLPAAEADAAVITTAQAVAAGRVFHTQTVSAGDPDATAANEELLHAAVRVRLNSQKHFYMETHAAYAVPHDQYVTVHLASQGSHPMSMCISHALGKKQHEVQVKQHRAGGAFGAKLASEHASMAALIALKENRSVKFQLDRNTDMRAQGGRQETDATVRIDFRPNGVIEGVTAECLKNCGHRFDWSSFTVLMLLPQHICAAYDVANRKIVSTGVQTNTITRCAVRAPGEIEAAFISEEIIERVAFHLGVHSQVVREANFKKDLHDNGHEPYTFPAMYESLMNEKGWRQRLADATAYNETHRATKRGVAITPFNYHLSCRGGYHAQINIYPDGSVLVHHCGVEMGQGLIIKVLQAAAHELSKVCGPLPLTLFKSAGNDTFTIPLGGVTGGSTGSEMSVLSVVRAAEKLVASLKPVAENLPEAARSWPAVVGTAMVTGVPLVADGHVTTAPGTNVLDYHCFCAGAAEIELDVRTGQVSLRRVDVKYDAARSLNPAVDIGQAEGAFMMGVGYLILEDGKLCEKTGAQAHDGTWEYKIPTVQDVPQSFNVELVQNEDFDKGILSSKASGEPPLCVATCVTSAIRQALTSARSDAGITEFAELTVPWTCDKLATACGSPVYVD